MSKETTIRNGAYITTLDNDYFIEEYAIEELLKEDILFCNSREFIERDFKDKSKYTIEESTLVLFVNCNDLFMWACADAEAIDLDGLKELYDMWLIDPEWSVSKWCCYKRNLQPQGPIIEAMKAAGVWDEKMESLDKGVDG
jgi:hypothetical protein